MLDDFPRARTPDLERLFRALLTEEQQRLVDDRRAAGRVAFVRPLVIIRGVAHASPIDAFSRNISPLGIGVVSKEPFAMGDVATIEVHRFHSAPSAILAECRWSDTFGSRWFFSGWSFLSIVRE
jgi:hypothetical protein